MPITSVAAAAMPTGGQIITLYRNLLRAAKVYPSKNRSRIVTDIKIGFRSSKALTDAARIEAEVAEAKHALKMMSGINSMIKSQTKDWSVTVGAE